MNYTSNCCSASPDNELDDIYGRCSECKENTIFEIED
jgi:hypothetical protein